MLLTGLAALPVASPVRAQTPEPLVTDRPDQTESTATVPGGVVQLEVGARFTNNEEGAVHVRELTGPSILVRLGVGRRLEARAGFSGWVRQSVPSATAESGIGDVNIGFKYRVSAGAGLRPSFAIVTTVTLPTAEEGFGSENVQPTVLLAAAHQLADRVGIGYNLGTAWTTVTGAAGSETSVDVPYSVSLAVSVSERVGAFVESFGSVGLRGDGPGRHSVDAGATMLVGANVQLDVSGGVALDAHAADWFLGAGASLRLPR
jgi:hypothetical protein